MFTNKNRQSNTSYFKMSHHKHHHHHHHHHHQQAFEDFIAAQSAGTPVAVASVVAVVSEPAPSNPELSVPPATLTVVPPPGTLTVVPVAAPTAPANWKFSYQNNTDVEVQLHANPNNADCAFTLDHIKTGEPADLTITFPTGSGTVQLLFEPVRNENPQAVSSVIGSFNSQSGWSYFSGIQAPNLIISISPDSKLITMNKQ